MPPIYLTPTMAAGLGIAPVFGSLAQLQRAVTPLLESEGDSLGRVRADLLSRTDIPENELLTSLDAVLQARGSAHPVSSSAVVRVLVANRGEAAVRDIRSIRDLYGKRAEVITVYTEGDEDADYVRMADRAIKLDKHNPRRTPYVELTDGTKKEVRLADNFNDEELLVETAQRAGAHIVSVKWGFQSESATLCERVEAAGMRFNGPGAAEMRKLGHKWYALEAAREAGLPVGKYSKLLRGADEAIEIAMRDFKFPNQAVMVKDCMGGGGKGNVKCENVAQLREAVERFLNAGKDVYFEEFVGGAGAEPKHIEVQGLGDGKGGAVTFGVRECSVQTKNHQKIIEQTYSSVPLAVLRDMEAKVQALFRNLGYRSAGTVEFLVEGLPDGSYRFKVSNVKFMEVNTRLQVEHTISEQSFGYDISRLMYELMEGKPLPLQKDIRRRAVSLEVRVTAENDDLKPQTGTITELQLPGGPGVRTDFSVSQNSRVGGDYDSMIGKIIVSEELRPYDPNDVEDEQAAMREAWERLVLRAERALKETRIHGLKTNLNLALQMIQTQDFRTGNVDTKWVTRFQEERQNRGFEFADNTDVAVVSAAIKAYLKLFKAVRDSQADRNRVFDERSLPPREGYRFNVRFGDFDYEVAVSETSPGEAIVRLNGSAVLVRFYPVTSHVYRIEIPGLASFNNFEVGIDVDEEDYRIRVEGRDHEFKLVPMGVQYDPSVHVAPVEGKLWLSSLQPGQPVLKGQTVAVLNVMKSEQDVPAAHSGVASQILMTNPDFADNVCLPLAKKQPLSRIDEAGDIQGIAKGEVVTDVLVKAGERVQAGQVLARYLPKGVGPGEEKVIVAERDGEVEWAFSVPPVQVKSVTVGGNAVEVRVVASEWEGARAFYPSDQMEKDTVELRELKKNAIHPRLDPLNLTKEGPFALVKLVEVVEQRDSVVPKPSLPFFRNHERDAVVGYRFADSDDVVQQIQQEILSQPGLLPQLVADLKNYYLGYDYPSDYIQRTIETLRDAVNASVHPSEELLAALQSLTQVFHDVWALFDSTFHEIFYILERHDFSRGYPKLGQEFEKALLTVAAHYGIVADSVSKIEPSEIGSLILRLKMAHRDRGLRRSQFEKVLGVVKQTDDERFTDILRALYTREKNHHDPRQRDAILDALASVNPVVHRQVSPARLSSRHQDKYEEFIHDRLFDVKAQERELVEACIKGQPYEGPRRLPKEVQSLIEGIQSSRPGAKIRRVRTPYNSVFAFEVSDDKGRSIVSIAHWAGDVNFSRDPQNRIVGAADLEDLARDAARSVHIYRALHQQLWKREEMRSRIGAEFTRNEVYLLAHSGAAGLNFIPEGQAGSRDSSQVNLTSVNTIAGSVEAFFHGAEINSTNLVFRGLTPDERFAVRMTRGPEGLHVKATGFEDLFRKIDKTEEMRQMGKWPVEDQAREFFDEGKYDVIEFDGVDARGAILARGLVDGLEYYGYFTDYRFAGGAFGNAQGQKLVAANLFAYLDQIPLVVFNDGAGANIKEGTISLDRSAEDFMMKVITGGFGSPERFARYVNHHPDQVLFRKLIDAYRSNRKLDNVAFNDLVSRVKNQIVKIAAQIGAGIGMVVYGSSLEEFQLMVNHPTAFRELTGAFIIEAETGQRDTDYNMGGAPLHSSLSGEIDRAFPSAKAIFEGIKQQLRFFDPRRMAGVGRRLETNGEPASVRDLDTDVLSATEIGTFADRGEILPFKAEMVQARGAITMFAQFGGVTMGILGARTQSGFGSEAAVFKATQLIEASDKTRSPILKVFGKSFVDPYRDGSPNAVRAWDDFESQLHKSTVPHIALTLDPEGIHATNVYRDTDIKVYVNQGKLSDSQPEGREALERIRRSGFEVFESLQEAFDFATRIAPYLNHERAAFQAVPGDDPISRTTDIASALISDDHAVSYDVRQVIGDIFDRGSFAEIGRGFNLPNEGPSLITGFASLGGKPVMVVGDDVQVQGGTADALGAEKYRRAKQLARLLGLPVISLGDSPAFKPGRLEEEARIQGRGADSIRENILSEVPEVHVVVRRGFGGRYIQDAHPWLRPGTRMLVVKGAMAAVMGPEGAVSLFEMRSYQDLRVSDPSQYERIKKQKVHDYREGRNWGDPSDPINRRVADRLIEKKNLRSEIAQALREAELDVETAHKLRYNILSTRERRVAALIERLDRMGFEAHARSQGEGRDRIEVRGAFGAATVDAEQLDGFFTAAPRATAAQVRGFLSRGTADASALGAVAARQQILSLKETLGLPVEEKPDGGLIVGAGQVFANTRELLSVFVAETKIERVALLLQEAGAEIVRRFHLDRTDSTMTQARDLAERGAPDGTVVTAGFQTAGQGRLNRTWYCPPGLGMMMSYVRRRPAQSAEDHIRIQFAASLAALQTLADFGASPRLKWPNDVYLDDRKVAGIKVDHHLDYQIIGVGVNVNTGGEEFPEEIRSIATSLKAATGREVPLRDFEDAFVANLEKILDQNADQIFAQVDAHALYRPGDSISAVIYDQSGSRQKILVGTVVGIDRQSGDLLVRDASSDQIQRIPEDNERITIQRNA